MQLNSDLTHTHTHSVDVSDVAVRTLMKNSERSREDKKEKKKKKVILTFRDFYKTHFYSRNTIMQFLPSPQNHK